MVHVTLTTRIRCYPINIAHTCTKYDNSSFSRSEGMIAGQKFTRSSSIAEGPRDAL